MDATKSTINTSVLWKGKARAVEQEFADLNPVITYKHLRTRNLGAKDPLRVIALCDSDAFYAACEMVRLGTDKDTPLVVLQWDSIIAVNYPARKYGISRMDKLKEARKRCEDLVVVHVATYRAGDKEPGYWKDADSRTHKVSLDHYRRESKKIAAMFQEELPGCEIEKASIDEAFFDFSEPGDDTPLPPPPPIIWDDFGYVVGDCDSSSELSDQDGTEVTNQGTTWHDVALSIAAELMSKARETVFTKLGYSTSAGIARNKFLAKLTASAKKPRGQSILRNAAIPGYLKPLEFQKIRNFGGKLGQAIAEKFNVTLSQFIENGMWIYEIARGIDRSEVKAKPSVNKSMLASKNLPKPITKASQGYHWIRVLAAELALRLNEARDAEPNLWPKTLVLSARSNYQVSRSKQTPFPSTREVSVDTIASTGNKLWRDLIGEGSSLHVSGIHLGFSGIEITEAGQPSLENFFKTGLGQPTKRTRIEDDDTDGPVSAPIEDATAPGRDALTMLRMEHEDFHFAQGLAEQDRQVFDLRVSSTAKKPPSKGPPPNKKQRPGKDAPNQGISAFFTPTVGGSKRIPPRDPHGKRQ
ncbi:hypothetical protein BD779DRAFT_1494510 [Infundibulicybe gibba]|nr:hypothetical protein BD779DRAFT_1494510 [Infundibulicybe gibba]